MLMCLSIHSFEFQLEIDIPKEFELIAENEEEESESLEEEDTWDDLGLAKFVQEQSGQSSSEAT